MALSKKSPARKWVVNANAGAPTAQRDSRAIRVSEEVRFTGGGEPHHGDIGYFCYIVLIVAHR